jgi:hypothetical protein
LTLWSHLVGWATRGLCPGCMVPWVHGAPARTGVPCSARTCAAWTGMWCDALTPALRAVLRCAVRWRRGAPAPVLVGAACALGWWAGWRRACWVGGQGGGPHIVRASRAVLASRPWGRPAWGSWRLRVTGRVCVGGRAAQWSVRSVLRLDLVVLLLCVCWVVLLLACAGVRMWAAPSDAALVCLLACLWWFCCSPIFGVTHCCKSFQNNRTLRCREQSIIGCSKPELSFPRRVVALRCTCLRVLALAGLQLKQCCIASW